MALPGGGEGANSADAIKAWLAEMGACHHLFGNVVFLMVFRWHTIP